ncbi:MAG: response regulator transcription factor [Flavobacteriales bacterium]|nr:response regulator transcription factor [Flavobacteriales bacterium]
MPYTAIISDDEKHSRETLRLELEHHCPEVSVLALCSSGPEAIAAVKEHAPDLIFLDVQMPRMDGFQVLEKLGDIAGQVIFVTAFDQYAIRAFRFSAVDYLLKPVQPEELKEAVGRAVSRLASAEGGRNMRVLMHNLGPEGVQHPRIALPTGDGVEFFGVDRIVRCEADSNYTHVHLQDKRRLLLSRTLKDVDEMLAPHGFFRCHQSHLINPLHLSKYVRSEGGYLVMDDGTSVPLAKSRRDAFHETFQV